MKKLFFKLIIKIFDKFGYTVMIYKKTKFTTNPKQILEIHTNGKVGINA